MIRTGSFFMIFSSCLLCWQTQIGWSQADTVVFTEVSSFPYPAPYSAYTAHFDRQGQPYIYTANKEYGVTIFDFAQPQEIKLVKSFPVQQFNNLKPTDLAQQGNYLYVSLGGFDGLATQSAGLAVLNVEEPANAVLLGQWDSTAFNKGCAAVRVDGNHAYLGAMEKGVIILDISDPAHPRYVSHLELDLNWPVPPGLFSVPHARGFALRGNDLWTCFDAGGLRRVDVSDKLHPLESTKYLNSDLDAVAQPAYNTATIAGDYLFAAVDYCGFDVVDISNPAQPASAAWINPWNCTNTSWDGSPGHTNQLATACHDSLLFLSGGDSEVIVYSTADPVNPARVGEWAVLKDSVVTWGLDVNDSLVVLAQIWSPLNFPYIAKKGGIRLLRWNCPQTTVSQETTGQDFSFRISPNPATGVIRLEYSLSKRAETTWMIFDALGRPVLSRAWQETEAGRNNEHADLSGLPTGVLHFVLYVDGQFVDKIFFKSF